MRKAAHVAVERRAIGSLAIRHLGAREVRKSRAVCGRVQPQVRVPPLRMPSAADVVRRLKALEGDAEVAQPRGNCKAGPTGANDGHAARARVAIVIRAWRSWKEKSEPRIGERSHSGEEIKTMDIASNISRDHQVRDG